MAESKTPILECEPCKEGGDIKDAVGKCVECDEAMCEVCQAVHRKQKATRFHSFTDIVSTPEINCKICLDRSKKEIPATGRCVDCYEFYCDACCKVHSTETATEKHKIIELNTDTTCNIRYCQICIVKGSLKEAFHYCFNCTIFLCESCYKVHRSSELTTSHTLSIMSGKARDETVKQCGSEPNSQDAILGKDKDVMHQPGKPKAAKIMLDSITLTWKEPDFLFENHHFQIRYKIVKDEVEAEQWKYHEEQPHMSTVILKALNSNTKYVFQIRMTRGDVEGPYSERSDWISTEKSAAATAIESSEPIELPEVTIPVKKISMDQFWAARNERAKTRRLVYGLPLRTDIREKTILVIGATGSGKSTLIEAMTNYVFGVTWEDPYRLSMIDLEPEEKAVVKNQANSQTKWITNYTIKAVTGSRLSYSLNIIDTPGFGDTRGIEQDKVIVEQIRDLFSARDSSGIVYLDAVCFVIIAPDARLTASQKYVFDSILSIFGKDIENNICMFVTFADGKRPPVLSALKEAGLPHELYFAFNNSGLFAENKGSNMTPMSPIFWNMGLESFEKFFRHLNKLETKSLGLTKEVLRERKEAELTIENLLTSVESGLHKVEELRLEIRIIAQHEVDIKANEDFTYILSETHQVKHDLPKGMYVTNCLHCHVTCHKDCAIPNDEDKKYCWAMGFNGNCTQCSDKCNWKQHANTPYIFEYEKVSITKTYKEKLAIYRHAESEKLTHTQVIERMITELDKYEEDILNKIEKLKKCNNRLKEIALRPNPLDTDGYIDVLIESEKNEQKTGFQERIHALNIFKRKKGVEKHVNRFHEILSDAKSSVLSYKIIDESKIKQKQSRGLLSFIRSSIDKKKTP